MNVTTTDLTEVTNALRAHERFVVTTHENPDGDALGSLLATVLTLRALGKEATPYLCGEVPLPDEYRFMRRITTRAAGSSSWSGSGAVS